MKQEKLYNKRLWNFANGWLQDLSVWLTQSLPQVKLLAVPLPIRMVREWESIWIWFSLAKTLLRGLIGSKKLSISETKPNELITLNDRTK